MKNATKKTKPAANNAAASNSIETKPAASKRIIDRVLEAAAPAAKKQAPAKKAAKKTAKPAAAKKGTKQELVLAMLREKGGATSAALMKKTGWQAHSLRGFLSAVVGKKLGLAITSEKNEAGERVYALGN